MNQIITPREYALLDLTLRCNLYNPLIDKLVFQANANLTAIVLNSVKTRTQEKVCVQAVAWLGPFVSGIKLTEWVKINTEEYLKTILRKEKDSYIVIKNIDISNDLSNSTPSEILFNSICKEGGKYLGNKYNVDFNKILREIEPEVIFASGLEVA